MAAPLDSPTTTAVVLRYFVLIFELQTYANKNITRTHGAVAEANNAQAMARA